MNMIDKLNILALIEIATNKIKVADGENAADKIMDAIRLLEISKILLTKSYKELTKQKDAQNEK